MKRVVVIVIVVYFVCASTASQGKIAPGGPGKDAHWAIAAKDGFGTANTLSSKVWFTLANGALTEVYYPTLDTPNVQLLQLIIVDGDSVENEVEDTNHKLEVIDSRSLAFRQINTAKSGNYKITKSYVTDPDRNALLIDIDFEGRTIPNVYVYYDPSLNNSGMHDTSWNSGQAMVAVDGDKASALISDKPFMYFDQKQRIFRPTRIAKGTNGFLGVNDGLTQLRSDSNRRLTEYYERAVNGNVVQVAGLSALSGAQFGTNQKNGKVGRQHGRCTFAVGFGANGPEAVKNARQSLAKGFARVQLEYRRGWHQFADRLPGMQPTYQKQFTMAAMVLHALEDKTFRGATIASPSIPWGGGANANETTVSGYHAVWSRDLYQVATALMAIGDRAAANRALTYLFNRQQKPDGSFPQNSRVDGSQIGGGQQMDQTALPIVLAYQLDRREPQIWPRIKRAADYLIAMGPATNQDRWEEKSGYAPATIAAEIAGLVCAANIATSNGDRSSTNTYLQTADEWQRRLDSWTATAKGQYARRYYLRITETGKPDEPLQIEINSGGGTFDQREIVDAGFLELVRLGIRRADDPLINESLNVVDKLIRVDLPTGWGWYRYNHDAYGETSDGEAYDARHGIGRIWTLLSGERGEYELARGQISQARRNLETMMTFANDGFMIPEQVWDNRSSSFRVGTGTGSATPLAWSMAQFIRLAINLTRGRNIETPRVVYDRYAKR
ncbi:MAG: glycoside hydrolase family 15 protein [Pyrinomonadaceae bacterium]